MPLKYLISACLAGHAVRYDAKSIPLRGLQRLMQTHEVITACPEILGGLSCPRLPAEIQNGSALDVLNGHAQVKDVLGTDVSKAFIEGAYQTLKLAQQHDVDIVVLKEFSPSCGTHAIYDGSFSRTKIEGQGITATLLMQHGFQVMSEHEFLAMIEEQF